MREEIFHSTLDWQTAVEFNRAAGKAKRLLAADRATYEELFRIQPRRLRTIQGRKRSKREGGHL